MTRQADLEYLLSEIPLETPQDVSHATDLLSAFLQVRTSVLETIGGDLVEGARMPPVDALLSIPALLQ